MGSDGRVQHDATRHTAGSLFSGIGGLDLGLHRAGWNHAFFCESDPYRRDVLRARFPGVPVYDDVACVPDERLQSSLGVQRFDLLAGGFPCQDLSVAGRRKGLAGDRSGLFHEFARITEALRPRALLVENVPGLLSSNGGRDFGIVLGTLAELGYGVGWRIVDSRYFGVPQRRRRVFIVGVLADGDPRAAAERAGEILAVGTRCDRHPATRTEAGADVAGKLGGGAGERGWAQDTERMTFVPSYAIQERAVSDSDTSGPGGKGWKEEEAFTLEARHHTQIVASPLSHGSNPNSNMAGRRREDDENLVAVHMLQDPISDTEITPGWGKGTKTGSASIAISNGAGVRRLTPTECERLQALPNGWTQLGSTADSKRYAALGDAVTASVAEWIGGRLLEHV